MIFRHLQMQRAIFREEVFSVFSLIRAQAVVCGQVQRSENNQSPSNHLGVSAPLPFWGLSNLNGSARPCFAISLGGTGGTWRGAWEKVEECAKSFPDSVEFSGYPEWFSFSRDRENVDRILVQYQNDYLDSHDTLWC